jgi:predicted DNA-binding transcriptional regulator AlpA
LIAPNPGAHVVQVVFASPQYIQKAHQDRSQRPEQGGRQPVRRAHPSHRSRPCNPHCRLRASPELGLLAWREGKGIQDTIEVALPTPYAKLPVAADSFFSVQDAQGRTHYFLEADRGRMTLERFTRKLAYSAYDEAERQNKKVGIRRFRVLTLMTGEARMQSLMQAARKAEEVRRAPATMFLFTTEEKLAQPESIFEKIWLRIGEEEPSSLGLVRKSHMEGESTIRRFHNMIPRFAMDHSAPMLANFEALPEILTAAELENFLRIDRKTTYRYVQKGLIPPMRIESNVRFSKHQVQRWLEERSFPPRPVNRNGAKRQ